MVSNKVIICACMFFIWKQIDYQKSESKPTVARADSKQAEMQTFDISYLEWTKKVSCMITPNQNKPTFTILHSLEEICMTCHKVASSLIHRFGKYYWVMHTPHSTRSCGFRFPSTRTQKISQVSPRAKQSWEACARNAHGGLQNGIQEWGFTTLSSNVANRKVIYQL